MSWETLINSLHVCRSETSPSADAPELLDTLVQESPSIYWYPGSGYDIMPLVLDAPGNLTGQHLFPLRGPNQDRGLILWMNDYSNWDWGGPFHFKPHLGDGVQDTLAATDIVYNTINRFIIPTEDQWQGRRVFIPMTVFQVRVTGGTGRYARPPGGDLYTAIYSAMETQLLFHQVFLPHSLQIRVVAIQRQMGNEYMTLPQLLDQYQHVVGHVAAYLVDEEMEISGYEPVRGRLRLWGRNSTQRYLPRRRPPEEHNWLERDLLR